VAILLTYATSRVLLAGNAEAREEEYLAVLYLAYTPGDSIWHVL
jgi:hypothetical protein